MKAWYQYRFYPTDQQKQALARLFGCVRVVWNDALDICKRAEKKLRSGDLQKNKQSAWLSEVSNILLQQSVADLDTAFKNFFDSCKGKRKGRKVRNTIETRMQPEILKKSGWGIATTLNGR
jgi:putative transposase